MKGNENKARDEFRAYCTDSLGIPTTLLNVSGQRGEVDLIVWMPFKHPIIIEWKQEGEEPRKNQELKHIQYKRLGYDVQVFKSLEVAKQYVNNLLIKLSNGAKANEVDPRTISKRRREKTNKK